MIPIFIITCNRLEVLKESIRSYYDCIKTPFEIIIVDFGSTYEPMREFLRHLEYEGKKVYWRKRIRAPKGLNKIDENIRDYFMTHPVSDYVVTDPDIALDSVDGDILDAYSYILKSFPGVSVVGPALRIDDIPDYYCNKERLYAKEERRYWTREPDIIQYKNKPIKYISTIIDSTFGMSRAGNGWWRRKRGFLTRPPYSAKHLDWYLDLDNPTPDQKYYMEHASGRIAHWSVWK